MITMIFGFALLVLFLVLFIGYFVVILQDGKQDSLLKISRGKRKIKYHIYDDTEHRNRVQKFRYNYDKLFDDARDIIDKNTIFLNTNGDLVLVEKSDSIYFFEKEYFDYVQENTQDSLIATKSEQYKLDLEKLALIYLSGYGETSIKARAILRAVSTMKGLSKKWSRNYKYTADVVDDCVDIRDDIEAMNKKIDHLYETMKSGRNGTAADHNKEIRAALDFVVEDDHN